MDCWGVSESSGQGMIVLGTRGSALALAQAEMTEAALKRAWPDLQVERRIIKTTGDRRTDVPLSEVAQAEHMDKGVFIKELEVALQEGEVNVAVHSLKDMPSVLEGEFAIAAVLPRAPVADVLLTRQAGGLESLPAGATVATSSVRRQRLLQWQRPDLKVADIRGNVPTRIRKLHEDSGLDGILLAEAGLVRLGLLGDGKVLSEGRTAYAEVLGVEAFPPAAGQGAVALEVRAGDELAQELARAVNDPVTMMRVSAERKFLALLGAGCETPVGVITEVEGDDLRLRAVVFEDGESEPLVGEVRGDKEKAEALATRLLSEITRG